MPRNNQDRSGPRVQNSDPPVIDSLEPLTPPLQFVVPTEFVELPSGGEYYPESHPLHDAEEIEIKFMTAKEEDILTDKTLLKKGVAIDRLLKNIIVDRLISPDSLLVGDKNAILIAARISAYGPEYDTKLVCPVCFSHGRHEFDLSEVKIAKPENLEALGVRKTPGGTLIFETPKAGTEVECKMLIGSDEKRMVQQQKNNKKLNLPESNLTNQLKTIIVSVNGNSEKQYINSFIETVPAFDSRYIRSTYQKCVANIDLREEYVCGECGASTEIDVPFTTDFFWPKR